MREKKAKNKDKKIIEKKPKKLIAKKPFEIVWNSYRRSFEQGDDISDIPELFHQNLKTEGII